MDTVDTTEQKELDTELDIPRRRRPLPIILLCLAVLAVIAAAVWFAGRNRSYKQAELSETQEIPAVGQVEMAPFAGGVLRYSSDGASLIDCDGTERWNISYTMNSPHLVTQGNCGALADLAGTRVVVFSSGGLSGSYTTALPILAIAVSGHGVTAVALDNSLNSQIRLYDSKGSQLDILISLEMSMSGYPLALALSPDGNGLVVSTVSSNIGALNSQLVFYNFSVGKNETNRLVGYFNYPGHLLPQVDYLNAKRVVAVTDDRVEVFSLAQENKPQLIKTVMLPGEISSYSVGEDHFAFLCPDRGTGELKLSVYTADGEPCFSETANGAARNLALTAYGTLLLTDQGLKYWSYTGKTCYSGTLARNGQIVLAESRNRLVQFDGSHIYHYTLK